MDDTAFLLAHDDIHELGILQLLVGLVLAQLFNVPHAPLVLDSGVDLG